MLLVVMRLTVRKFMPNRFSNKHHDILLHAFQIDWPCEIVALQTTVVPLRSQNIFRWAVIRIFEQFDQNPPSLKTAAEQLGMMDPVFLADTLDEMIADGSVEIIDSLKPVDFSNCRPVQLETSEVVSQPSEPGRGYGGYTSALREEPVATEINWKRVLYTMKDRKLSREVLQ